MRQRTPSLVWWLAGLGGLGLLLALTLTALVFGRFQSGADASAFDDAERTWQAQQLAHYRITTGTWVPWGPTSGCVQELEIQRERVVAIVRNTCSVQPVTVSALFQRIRPFVRHRVCGAGGCLCDGYVVVKAEYDAQLGYPRSVNVALEQPRLLQLFLRVWPAKWANCALMGATTEPGTVVQSLTPLP